MSLAFFQDREITDSEWGRWMTWTVAIDPTNLGYA
jgi:hypothetical protein